MTRIAISTLLVATSMMTTTLLTGATAARSPVELGAAATAEPEPPPVGRAAPPNLWPEIERLRTELWAANQTVRRLRVERNQLRTQLHPPADPVDRFTDGYQANGGTNVNAILAIAKCESGLTDPTIDNEGLNRNGTVDHGFLQINDGVWSDRFETVTGRPFATHVYDAYWNGYMGAHIEDVQGWSAWSASRHCHGVT